MGCINCKPEKDEVLEVGPKVKQRNKCRCCICRCCIKNCKCENDGADKVGETVKRKKKCKCCRKNGKVCQEEVKTEETQLINQDEEPKVLDGIKIQDNTDDEWILKEVKPAYSQPVGEDRRREYNVNQTKEASSTYKCEPPKKNTTVILPNVTENEHNLAKNKENDVLSEQCEREKKDQTNIPPQSDKSISKKAKDDYFNREIPHVQPPSSRKIKPPSLTNVGATCYLNSAFQGISACDTFVSEINDLCLDYLDDDVKQLHVFKALMDILNGGFYSRMEISHNPIFRDWNKPGQQDSYELLAYALNQVYNQLRHHKESVGEIKKRDLQRWLQEKLPMRFIIQYTILCGCGMVTKSPLQSDLALHVSITRNKGECHLNDLIDLYFQDDPIEDYECDNKGCTGTCTKRVARLCRPLPKTICIHLQRTYWNGYSMVKINRDVVFTASIKMKPLYWSDCLPEVSTKDSHPGGDSILEAQVVEGGNDGDRRSFHVSSDEEMKSDIKDSDGAGLNEDVPLLAEEDNQSHEGEDADITEREVVLMVTEIVKRVIENSIAEIEKGCPSFEGVEEEVIVSKEHIRSEEQKEATSNDSGLQSLDDDVGGVTKTPPEIKSEYESRKLDVKNEDADVIESEIDLMATGIVKRVIENMMADIEKGCPSLEGVEEVIASKEHIRSEEQKKATNNDSGLQSLDDDVGGVTEVLQEIKSENESRKLDEKNESDEMKKDEDGHVNHYLDGRPNIKYERSPGVDADIEDQHGVLDNTFPTTNGSANPDDSETGATGSVDLDGSGEEKGSKLDHHSVENTSSTVEDSMTTGAIKVIEAITDIHNIGYPSRISVEVPNIKLDSKGGDQKEPIDCEDENIKVREENKTIVDEQENMKIANDFKAKGERIDKAAKDLIVGGSEALPRVNIGGTLHDSLVEPDEEYSLVSVIVHYGTVYGGHYICYKKVGSSWFLTDDSSIREVSEAEVLKCQAYILFYEQPYCKDNNHSTKGPSAM